MILELCAAVVLAAAPRAITLEQVREESRNNVTVLNAELEQARAAEQIRIAQSSIYPQLSAGTGGLGTYGRNTSQFALDPSFANVETLRGTFDLDVTVSQLLYDGGKWWNQIAQADSSAKAAEGKTEEQRLSSVLEGTRRFYELFRAQKTLEVLETSVKRSEQQLERARALFEAGRSQKGDSFAAEVNLGNDRLEVVRQRARIVDAQTKLSAWLARDGLTPLVAETPAAFDHDAEPPPPVTLEDAIAAARSARPLFRALSDQV
ncbi:MAG: TolC family protein, partial [Myxococcaceae bacterium]